MDVQSDWCQRHAKGCISANDETRKFVCFLRFNDSINGESIDFDVKNKVVLLISLLKIVNRRELREWAMGEVRRDDERTEERRREAAIRRAASMLLSVQNTKVLSILLFWSLKHCSSLRLSVEHIRYLDPNFVDVSEEKERAEQESQAKKSHEMESVVSAESLRIYWMFKHFCTLHYWHW